MDVVSCSMKQWEPLMASNLTDHEWVALHTASSCSTVDIFLAYTCGEKVTTQFICKNCIHHC